jgi:hypothetical protein
LLDEGIVGILVNFESCGPLVGCFRDEEKDQQQLEAEAGV